MNTDLKARPGRDKRLLTLIILIPITLLFHVYSHLWVKLPEQSNFFNHVLSDVCYIPIILAAVWYGLRGAVISTSIVAAYFFLFIVVSPPENHHELTSDYVEIMVLYLIGGVSGIILDKDRRLRKLLHETQRRAAVYNRSLIESSLDPLVTIGPDGRITDVNDATEIVTGLDREDLIGTDFSYYFTEPEKARAGYLEVFREGAVRDYPLDIKHQDGHITPVLYNASVYKDETGQVTGVFATARDITERKKAEDAVRKLNEELEQRVRDRTAQLEATNKDLESFSYSVSHDLRAPLRAIDGFSRIILEDYLDKLDDEGKRLLRAICRNTQNMAQLIDDLLDFSRTGRQRMVLACIDMNKLASDVFENIKAFVKEREIDFSVMDAPETFCDYILMRQAMTNLISNAVKFTKSQKRAVIEFGGRTDGRENIYYFKDNGVGFDMQYIDKIFGVFQRLHKDDEFEGTGVGLAIVQRVIQMHGGKVWAESTIGKGATFYFALPNGPR